MTGRPAGCGEVVVGWAPEDLEEAVDGFAEAVVDKDLDAMRAVLHPDVTFSSPAVFTPYRGRDAVLRVLGAVMAVFEDFRYTARFDDADSPDHVLRFTARVGDKQIEGVDILRLDDAGLVLELTVLIRPLKGLHAVVEAMGHALAQS